MKHETTYCNNCELNVHSESTPQEERIFGCKISHKNAIPLADAVVDKDYNILCNTNQKYYELGMYHGSTVRIIKNNKSNRNLIVAVGSSRYIISRNIAKNIAVTEGGG